MMRTISAIALLVDLAASVPAFAQTPDPGTNAVVGGTGGAATGAVIGCIVTIPVGCAPGAAVGAAVGGGVGATAGAASTPAYAPPPPPPQTVVVEHFTQPRDADPVAEIAKSLAVAARRGEQRKKRVEHIGDLAEPDALGNHLVEPGALEI